MRKAILIAVMFAMVTGGVFAQLQITGFTSPQSTATQGRIRSAADDFIRPDSYTSVTFDNWYGMASFASGNTAALGYAAKIGGKGEAAGSPLYLGVFYTGRFWDGITPIVSTENYGTWLGEAKKVTSYTAPNFAAGGSPSNQIAVLIGVADMGFRLSFLTTYQIFNVSDVIVGAAPYKSYLTESGAITPQLAWSMTKNLIENGIKPWATIQLGFNRNYTKTAAYNFVGGDWVATETIGNSQNTILPELNVGLGGYILGEKDGWRTSADIEYRLQITVYDNEYNYVDADGNAKIKNFNGTYNGTNLVVQSYASHRIRPSLNLQWNGEKLRLRGRLELNLNLSNTENTPKVLKPGENNGALQTADGTATTTSVFEFTPNIQLAAQWLVTPKFFLNIGALISPGYLRSTTVDTKTYNSGTVVDNTTVTTVTPAFGTTNNGLYLGVTLNATDNLGIEAATGLQNGTRANVFDTSAAGLFNFGSILVSLKF
jgi:hypothetical protein